MSAVNHKCGISLVRTELSSPLAIDRHIRPLIRPVNLARFPQRKYRLDCESHAGFAHTNGLVLGIVRYPRRRVELCVDAVAAPGSDHIATSRLGMLLDDFSELPYRSTRLHNLDGLIQALTGRLNYPDRIWIGFGSLANVVRFVQVSMITAMVQ